MRLIELIDRNALLEAYDKAHKGPPGAARKLIENAPTVGGWISVKDRLPEEKLNPYTGGYQEVICFIDTRVGCDVRTYEFGRGHFWSGLQEVDKYITHWMPLPEPPKET